MYVVALLTGLFVLFWWPAGKDELEPCQQDHWSESGRATSVGCADVLGRPLRSVLAFANTINTQPRRRPLFVGIWGWFQFTANIVGLIVTAIIYFSNYPISQTQFVVAGTIGIVSIAVATDTLKGGNWARIAQIVVPAIAVLSQVAVGYPVALFHLLIWIHIALYFWRNAGVIAFFRGEQRRVGPMERHYYALIMAGLTVHISDLAHSITRPQQDSVIVTRLFTGDDAFVQKRTCYAWHFFQRGVVFGDSNVTPLGKFLYQSFRVPLGGFRVLDPTNPTPFMLSAVCLFAAAFLAIRAKKPVDE